MKLEILEDKSLVAQFMGAKVEKPYSDYDDISGSMFYYSKEYPSPHIFLNVPLSGIKYDSCFSWLMPVIEKIAKLKLYDDSELEFSAYPITFGRFDDGLFMFRLNNFPLHTATTLIEAAYEGVVEFILWYNTNKK